MSLWTPPRTWTDGEMVTTAMLNQMAEELAYLHDRFQAGQITITPSASGTPTSLDVVFPVPFLGRPHVWVSYHGNVPGKGASQVEGVAGQKETETGFTAWVTRNSVTDTQLNWFAIQQ